MLIDTTEIEDFEEIIKDAGLNLADFELREQKIHLPKPAQEADAGMVIVRRRRTGAERSYNYLHWVVDFADDLRDGVFD
jgi:hypothetical protein